MKTVIRSAALLPFFCMLAYSVQAAELFDVSKRRTIDMPAPAVAALRGEMVSVVTGMQQVFVLSAEGKYAEAADLAENSIGQTAMTQHMATIRPGMFFSPEMRVIAQAMHQRGSDWSFALRTGDRKRADTAYAGLLGTCTACHQNFQAKALP